jgi:hypothetical protein
MDSAGHCRWGGEREQESREDTREKVAILVWILQQKVEEDNKDWNLLLDMMTGMKVLM